MILSDDPGLSSGFTVTHLMGNPFRDGIVVVNGSHAEHVFLLRRQGSFPNLAKREVIGKHLPFVFNHAAVFQQIIDSFWQWRPRDGQSSRPCVHKNDFASHFGLLNRLYDEVQHSLTKRIV
jgi:hypothetical protein